VASRSLGGYRRRLRAAKTVTTVDRLHRFDHPKGRAVRPSPVLKGGSHG